MLLAPCDTRLGALVLLDSGEKVPFRVTPTLLRVDNLHHVSDAGVHFIDRLPLQRARAIH